MSLSIKYIDFYILFLYIIFAYTREKLFTCGGKKTEDLHMLFSSIVEQELEFYEKIVILG